MKTFAMKMNCLLVDDEPLALDVLKTHIQHIDSLRIVGHCKNAIEAFQLLQERDVDLLFLDIQMPKLDGISFLNTLKNPPKVIFTTAYRDYAIKAFEVDAIDYLLKPISFGRLLKAVNKAVHLSQFMSSQPVMVAAADEPMAIPQLEYLYVKADRKMVKINLNEILYVESLKDYVCIYTLDKRIVTKQKISYLEEKLPPDAFLRIHRSFIIAVAKLNAFTATSVEIGEQEIPIGRSYKSEVDKFLSSLPE